MQNHTETMKQSQNTTIIISGQLSYCCIIQVIKIQVIIILKSEERKTRMAYFELFSLFWNWLFISYCPGPKKNWQKYN